MVEIAVLRRMETLMMRQLRWRIGSCTIEIVRRRSKFARNWTPKLRVRGIATSITVKRCLIQIETVEGEPDLGNEALEPPGETAQGWRLSRLIVCQTQQKKKTTYCWTAVGNTISKNSRLMHLLRWRQISKWTVRRGNQTSAEQSLRGPFVRGKPQVLSVGSWDNWTCFTCLNNSQPSLKSGIEKYTAYGICPSANCTCLYNK